MATIEGPIVGALVLFALQETLSAYGAWYLVIVGALAVVTTLVAPRGVWGLASERLGWSLLPVGYRVRSPAPPGPAGPAGPVGPANPPGPAALVRTLPGAVPTIPRVSHDRE